MWMLLLFAACNKVETTEPDDSDTIVPPVDTTDTADTTDTTDTTPEPPPGGIQGFSLVTDTQMKLMIHATFTDPGSSEAWVEYRFETDEWLIAPLVAPGEAVILGIPAVTEVEARAAAVVGEETVYSQVLTATTGSVPPFVLEPTVSVHDATIATPEPYVMTSVSTGTFTFQGPYVLEIYDRQGRIVWYHVVPDDLFSLYPAPVRAGTHIWYDAEDIFGFASGDPHILQSTLDGRWSLRLETPNAGQAYAEGPDGSFFYELRSNQHGVLRVDADGTLTLEWDCDAHMDSIGADDGDCLLNGCNWDPVRDTILASQFPSSTVFEIDRSTQQAFRQMGQLEEGDPYTFDPANSMFAYQHWPYWTPEGTLFVSTHACGNTTGCVDNDGVSGIQIAAEYAVDDATQTLTLVSSVVSTDLWATQSGEAYRLPNGNVVQGYGQDGAVREIAPDGSIAFEVYWPRDISDYRAIGHTSFIADLYALNQGPP